MRAIWDEVRLAFRLTFVDGYREVRRTGKSHPGWFADPHLRKGFLWALPGILVLFPLLFWAMFVRHKPLLFYAYGLPVAFAMNLAWLGAAAYLRANATEP